jgi:hypothetical protein
MLAQIPLLKAEIFERRNPMLSQEIEEMLANRLVNRINEANAFILQKIGSSIKEIATLTPTQAYQLGQMIKYGGSYQDIAKQLAKITGLNVQDIYKIFDEVAQSDKNFARQFYKYRNMNFIPYKYDKPLQNQVEALARITAMQYINFSNTTAIGYAFKGLDDKITFKNIQQTYNELIDKAILSVSQGKTDFYSEMRNTLKQLGRSGLVVYDSGHTRRLDSAVRMNMLDGIRDLHNELTLQFGEEYNADGVEISHHPAPAPDHSINDLSKGMYDIDGHQFSLRGIKKVNGIKYEDWDYIDSNLNRPCGTLNCYHRVFNIILGVSKPEYTEEELEKEKKKNLDGFVYNGKHYTLYEGQQLLRKVETEIRRNKDTQILAKASGDKELILESQNKIHLLTNKYKEILNASGLQSQFKRASVSGYKKVAKSKLK